MALFIFRVEPKMCGMQKQSSGYESFENEQSPGARGLMRVFFRLPSWIVNCVLFVGLVTFADV